MEREEFFDVVDEHDNVIESLPRSEVHRRKLRHRAAHIFLFQTDGQMLIHLRSADKVEFPSVWTSSASGHVSSGEDYEPSAARELQEELGIDASLTRFGKFAACPETCNEFTELFIAQSDSSVVPDPREIQDIRWLLPDEIEREVAETPELFSPAFRLLFNAFRRNCGRLPD